MENNREEMLSEVKLAFAAKRYDTVLAICQDAFDRSLKDVRFYSLAGNAYLVQKQLDKAKGMFLKAVELDPGTGERYFELGNCEFGLEEYNRALAHYSKALQLGCSSEVKKKVHYLVGFLNQLKGDNKSALLNYDKSADINGDNSDQKDLLLNKIQIYAAQRDVNSAINTAIQMKLLYPGEFKTYHLLFQLYMQSKDIQNACDVLDEAVRDCGETPENAVDLGFDRALLCVRMADIEPERSNEYFRQADEQLAKLESDVQLSDKDLCEAWMTRSDINIKVGDMEQAEKMARQVLNRDSEGAKTYHERALFNLIRIMDVRKRFSDVIDYAQKLKSSENDVYRHYAYYADVFAAQQLAKTRDDLKPQAQRKYDLAIAYYKNCTVKKPGDFMAFLYRARCYVDTGRFDQAEYIGRLLPADAQKILQDYIEKVRKEVNG